MTVLDSSRQVLSIKYLKSYSTETAFGIPKFKPADADLMAPVLEASKKWQNGKKTLFYVLVSTFYVLVSTCTYL